MSFMSRRSNLTCLWGNEIKGYQDVGARRGWGIQVGGGGEGGGLEYQKGLRVGRKLA